MKFYYVYMLRCRDNSFYTGVTNNVDIRVDQHNAGINPDSYTYSRRPVILAYVQEFMDPLQAIAFEKRLKKWSRAKKEALIRGDFDMIQILAECRNATHSKYKPDA